MSFLPATVLKTEAGSLPEGKVKIKLEHDGTILEVDEDDIDKVRWQSKCPYLHVSVFTYKTFFYYTNFIIWLWLLYDAISKLLDLASQNLVSLDFCTHLLCEIVAKTKKINSLK